MEISSFATLKAIDRLGDKLMADFALAFPVIAPSIKPGVAGAYVR